MDRGEPEANVKLRSFNRWVETIGGILNVAGIGSFLENQLEFQTAGDTIHDSCTNLFHLWWASHGSNKAKAEVFLNFIEEVEIPITVDGKSRGDRVKSLGHQLRSVQRRRFGDYSVEVAGTTNGSKNWRVLNHVQAEKN